LWCRKSGARKRVDLAQDRVRTLAFARRCRPVAQDLRAARRYVAVFSMGETTLTASHVLLPMNPLPQPESFGALDLIFIEGFVGQTVIGIPQPLQIDLQAGLQRARACDTDRITDTIDYSQVHTRLQRLLNEHRLQLLEALAEAIARILIDEFGARWVRVKLAKPNKFDGVQAVGVLIERRAGERVAPVLQLIGAGMVPGKR
jgi:7,8-dihydroneopterin aldolase/epimerase/oxygenase